MVNDPFGSQKQYWESPHQWYKDTKGMYRPQESGFQPQAPGSGDVGSVEDWGYRGSFETPQRGLFERETRSGYERAGTARGRQTEMLDYLSAVAQGRGDSMAQQAQRQALSQLQSQAAAQMTAARSPAEARLASYQGAAAGQEAAQRGALASMQEQRAAQQAVLQGAGQMRGQDIEGALAAQQGRLSATQAEALRQQMEAKFLQLGLTDREARRRAQMAMEGMQFQAWEGQQGREAQMNLLQEQMDAQFWQSLLGGGMAAGGSMIGALAMSDKRAKTDVQDADMKQYLASCAGAKNIQGEAMGFMDDPALMNPDYSVSPIEDVMAGQGAEQKRQQQMYGAVGSALEGAGERIAGANEGQPMAMQLAQAAEEGNRERAMRIMESMTATPDPLLAVQKPEELVASDERAKTDVRDFMDEMKAYRYRYKDPEKHGRGERIGVMAQDMERSRLGDELVVKKGGMRHIDMDPQKFNPVVLASLADLNKRMNELEER